MSVLESDQKAGMARVMRGGAWNNTAQNLRSGYRNRNRPDDRNNNLGFRAARAQVQEDPLEPEQILFQAILPLAKLNGDRCVSSLSGCQAKTHRFVAEALCLDLILDKALTSPSACYDGEIEW